VRALLATLLMSRGMPLIQQGDEMGRTQRGNNNAYAQDNDITWVDWEGADGVLVDFVAAAQAFRKAHPALSADHFLSGQSRHGERDVVWWHQDGREMSPDDWSNADQSMLGMQLRIADDEVLVWFNRHAEEKPARLPEGNWAVGFVSAEQEGLPIVDGTVTLPPRSVVALVRAQVPPDKPSEVPPEKGPEPAREPEGVPPSGPPEQDPTPVEAPPPQFPTDVPPTTA
jgi:glycogen operon protein